MQDIVVLLPGITGSVLQKDGIDLWALSGRAFWEFAASIGASLQDLKLEGDDPELDDLGDGIKATRLVQDAHFVPGLVKIDGYTTVAERLKREFNLAPGNNYFELPYDWRRDNRVAARKLERLIQQKLPTWRKASGANKTAKVILIAHSMGGLIARYYLEVLGGWETCRALITFGTPYRGSVNSLDFLANGYKKSFLDLTEVMRSFTSVYQLLPIYEMVSTNGEHKRIADLTIDKIDRTKAEHALQFHREIESAQLVNAEDVQYQNNYLTVPYVGTEQKTSQSAVLTEKGELTVSLELPGVVPAQLGSGDGTVPRVSASPIEFDKDPKLRFFSRYIAERHGSIQNNVTVLIDLLYSLQALQVIDKEPVRGDLAQTAISLELDDLYLSDEPIIIRATLLGRFPPSIRANLALEATIELVSKLDTAHHAKFQQQQDGQWLLEINNLEPGLYRIEVRTNQVGGAFPSPVHELFEVGA